jgi:hypothetical protein
MGRTTLRRGAGTLLVAMVAATTVWPLSVSAATHVITLDKQIIRGEEGDRVNLGVFITPQDLIGQVCSVTVVGNNNRSVHPGNDVEVSSFDTVILPAVEDSPNKETVSNGELTLNEEISFTLVLGPDGVYSAELQATLNCRPQSTTTTSSTTTTTEETTTTTGETTTTSSTTTTVPPEASSTSTTSTPVAETTTSTTPPEVAPDTIAPTTTGATPDTLPFTGVSTRGVALVAYLALAAGIALVSLSRRHAND